MESKSNQVELICPCDASTSAHDPRIDELQEAIISKDAKLSAMQNSIAVMRNDVCEPYCIYAHIYTALAKIFGILCQNEKYKRYLDLMSSGKDTKCIDIKGRILYKLKVLEKFSLALIAPCSKESHQSNKSDENCACYHAEIITHVETTLALSSSHEPALDKKRAHLVADIMEYDEMREILSKENTSFKFDDEINEDLFCIENYSIDTENLNRLKSLQVNYDELMNCYENLKHEKDCLKIRCEKYEELERELLSSQSKLREYNSLWNEKEHYRKRSEDLDSLKEQYLILSEETSNLETQLKAEVEINCIKSSAVDDLRNENLILEKKLSEALIAFEKERNVLQCKLKETECQVMCQEQQIKSLSIQIDKLLENDHDKKEDLSKSIVLIDEMESLRDQIKNLKDALYCTEEEKLQLQEQFHEKLKLINDLKMEIEDWKSTYEKTVQRNECLERCAENYDNQIQRLTDENKILSQEIEEKTAAVENLIHIINNKSLEINNLMDEIQQKRSENRDLIKELQKARESYDSSVKAIEDQKKEVFNSLHLARRESKELLEKVKSYDEMIHKKEDIARHLETQKEEYNELKEILTTTINENKKLQIDLENRDFNNASLLKEIQRLRELNNYAVESIHNLQDEKKQYKMSFELTKKESDQLENKLIQFEGLEEQLSHLTESYHKSIAEKNKLEDQLLNKTKELDEAIQMIHLTKKESNDLIEQLEQSDNLKEDFMKLNNAYQRLLGNKQNLQIELTEKNRDLDNLIQSLNNLKKENENLLTKCQDIRKLEQDLTESKKMYEELSKDFEFKTEEINRLYNTLDSKIEENQNLHEQIKTMKLNEAFVKNKIDVLQNEHLTTQTTLEAVNKESEALISKLKNYETLATEFEKLKQAHDQMKSEKDRIQKDLDKQVENFKRIQQENNELNVQSQNLLVYKEDLEKALINARNEITTKLCLQNICEGIEKEIEELKKEKLKNQNKIKDLLDKLDESENIISNLSEDVLARDDKIAILENHINSLEDEVRRLHTNLAAVVDTGEELKENYHKIDQSLFKMEAHHSKATHNMKMELAKLQNENSKLEQQLSVTKQESDESLRDKHKYATQIINLQNEREVIVADIKQLEISSVGDSTLSPENCSTENILASLDRIRKFFNVKNSKTTTLKQTILKVQTSSQLLLSKADEAKRIVEKEKQKIQSEKEEAITARLNMEKQLVDLKQQLEQQANHDKCVIKDLEAEILNQKLIIDKLNNSTKNYISKLEEEMRGLQNLYQNSLLKVNDFQEKINNLSEDKRQNLDIIEKINKHLEEKSQEVVTLRKRLEQLKPKELRDFGIQSFFEDNQRDISSQTDRSQQESYEKSTHKIEPGHEDDVKYDAERVDNLTNINMLKINKTQQDKHITGVMPKQKPQSINEVQILTANVEPTINFVRNIYLNYKLNRLGLGRIEQYSISDELPQNNAEDLERLSFDKVSRTTDANLNKPHLVDLYNRQSPYTASSKIYNLEIESHMANKKDPNSVTKSTPYIGFNIESDIFISESNADSNKFNDSNIFIGSASDKSTDKDLFIIYRDSETSENDKEFDDKELYHVNKEQEILIESIAVKATKKQEHKDKSIPKTKLKIEMPRVDAASTSATTTPNSINTNLGKSKGSNANHYNDKDLVTDKRIQSHHKLSRVDANFLLVKNENNLKESKLDDPGVTEEPGNFGLEYILNSVQQQVHPGTIISYNTINAVRVTKSDDIFQTDSCPSKLSQLKSSTDYKTILSFSPHKSSEKFHRGQQLVTDRSILVKTDTIEEYEEKIRNLSNALENTERDYKIKIEAIKVQYDNNIKSIINEHNQGVKSIQNLHEETLQDIIKLHENEVENLRSMSMDAMRRAEKIEKENRLLKRRIQDTCTCLDEEPVKMSTPELKRRKSKCRGDTKTLTKTNVEAFNVKPKLRSHGPCTCSLDINISDTIRNIFEQVDVEQRKMAEYAYLKYIANKILTGNFEALDSQELSFLHLKVCRTWKSKLTKEEALQKRIDTLENELMNKQRHAQQHIAELDRKVAEERRRLQEVREAVCRPSPAESRVGSSDDNKLFDLTLSPAPSPPPGPWSIIPNTDLDRSGGCVELGERRSAGDLGPGMSSGCLRVKQVKTAGSKAVLAKLDIEERREKKLFSDEPPTRLRRAHAHDRAPRAHKK